MRNWILQQRRATGETLRMFQFCFIKNALYNFFARDSAHDTVRTVVGLGCTIVPPSSSSSFLRHLTREYSESQVKIINFRGQTCYAVTSGKWWVTLSFIHLWHTCLQVEVFTNSPGTHTHQSFVYYTLLHLLYMCIYRKTLILCQMQFGFGRFN